MSSDCRRKREREREVELFEEIELFSWEVLCLNETWRGTQKELWTSQQGHLFGGSGGTPGRSGTAIILHRNLQAALQSFNAVSDRLAVMDFLTIGKRFRVIAAYMPHSQHTDGSVEQIYEQLTRCVKEGRRQKRIIVLAGDWNARIGQHIDGDGSRVMGKFGYGAWNARGQWLIDWALLNRLSIVNSKLQKRPERQ